MSNRWVKFAQVVLLVGAALFASMASAHGRYDTYDGNTYKRHRGAIHKGPRFRRPPPPRMRRHEMRRFNRERYDSRHRFRRFDNNHYAPVRHPMHRMPVSPPVRRGPQGCRSVSDAIWAVKRNYPGSSVLNTRYGKRGGQIVFVVVKIIDRQGRVTSVKVTLC